MVDRIETVETVFDGVTLLAPKGILWPHPTFYKFPSCCGAGWTEPLVPEHIYHVIISPACFIHDTDWAIRERTWDAFHALNSRFLHNMIAIIEAKQKWYLRHLSYYRAVSYYNAVDTLGATFYFREHRL